LLTIKKGEAEASPSTHAWSFIQIFQFQPAANFEGARIVSPLRLIYLPLRIRAGLAEQLEGQLRGLVRLGQDGDACLGQDLGPGHVSGFGRHIHIDDP
jgi:hypothetical protein